VRALQDASSPDEVQRQLEEAQQTFARAMQDAWIPEGAKDPIVEGQRAYMRALQEGVIPGEVQKRFDDAQRDQTAALRQAWAPDEFGRAADEAYRNYVREIREALGQADSEIDADILAEAGQSMLASAQLATTAQCEIQHRKAMVAQIAAGQSEGAEATEAGAATAT